MSAPLSQYEHGYTCVEVVELATDYVDGALSPRDATLFELHLNFCDGCMTFVDQIRTSGELAAQVAEDVSPELQSKLLVAFRDWRSA